MGSRGYDFHSHLQFEISNPTRGAFWGKSKEATDIGTANFCSQYQRMCMSCYSAGSTYKSYKCLRW